MNTESSVTETVVRNHRLALLDALSAPQDEASVLQALIAAASAQCRAWPTPIRVRA